MNVEPNEADSSRCPVTRGEVDLDRYAAADGVWRALKVPAPARRALVDAGVVSVDNLRRVDFEELAKLHGIGPRALAILRSAQ